MKISSINTTEEVGVSHNSKIRKHVLISKGEIENITNFSQAVFPPGEIAYAHCHPDMTEVFFIESGHGTIKVDEKTILLEAGMCVTVEPNETHEIRNTGSIELVVTYFGVIT